MFLQYLKIKTLKVYYVFVILKDFASNVLSHCKMTKQTRNPF